MEFKLIKLREDMIKESGYLLKNMSSHLDSKITRYVNFSLEFLENPIPVPVFYSTKYRYWSARYKDKDELIHAFGIYDEQKFMMANFKPRSLDPLFVFALPINYESVKYEALFVKQGKEMHLMPKIYDLNDNIKEYLIKEGLVLELEDEDYLLFDFGNSHRILKFLNRVKRNVKTFNFELNDSGKLTINLNPYKTFVDNKGYNYCMMCGAKLNVAIHKELKEVSEKFEAKCEHCLEKIHVLDFYFKLKDDSISKYISEESIKDYFDDANSAYYMWSLLVKFNMLNHFTGDLYTLQANSYIEESFTPFLKAPEPEISETKSKLDDYWSQYDDEDEDEEERFCEICGKPLETELGDICDDCFNKQEAVKSLKNLLEYVSPGVGFSKSDLLKQGFSILELDILVDDLVSVGLLKSIGDDNLFILEKTSVLNSFIEEYSDEELITTGKEEVSEDKILPSIRSIDLATEESLDKVFNLVNYTKYVYSSYDRRIGKWYVEFKDDGKTLIKKMFKTPFEAKLSAINYLSEINIINIISDNAEEVSIDIKSEEHRICPICGEEFTISSKFGNSQKYCDKCRSKFNGRELQVLTLINNGKITQETSNKISNLLDEGKNKAQVSRILKLDSSYFIDPILKFLPPNEVEYESSEMSKTKKRVCPICNKEFYIDSSSTQKYCDECKNKYNSMELMALVLINTNRVTQKTSNKISELLNKGLSKTEVRERLNLGNTSLIDPILKFLPPTEEEDKLKTIINDSRICTICGGEFYPNNKFSSSQRYCNKCRSKYTSQERNVLIEINEGKITQNMSNKAKSMLNNGFTKNRVAENLGLKSGSYVDPILKFLPPTDVIFDFNNHNENNLILKKCLVCNKEFYGESSKSGQKYCEECKSKYESMELLALRLINEGKIIQSTSNKISKLLSEGVSKNEIAKRFNLGNPAVIDSILKFLPPKVEIKEDLSPKTGDNVKETLTIVTKTCPICLSEFEVNTLSTQKHCDDCISMYSQGDLEALTLINTGKITKIDSNKMKELLNVGLSDKEVSERFKLENSESIHSIFKFLPPENNISPTKPYKLLKVVKHSNYINVILKGIISNRDRFALFTRSSFLDEFNLNYIECKKVGKYFEINIDLSFRKNEAKSHINKFKSMGWVEK